LKKFCLNIKLINGVKMKKTISMFAIFFVATLVIGLTSCTKDNPISTNDGTTFDYVSAGTYVEPIQLGDATLDNEITLQNELTPNAIDNGTMFGGPKPVFNFREIFPKLNLTDNQKTQIQAIMKEHYDCERNARMAYHQAIAAILADANAQRRAILDDLKAGNIDKKEAATLLKALNDDTRAKIKESGALETLQAALKGCTETMISKIMGILDENQKPIFQHWLDRIKNGGGKGGPGGTGPGGKG
jgi:hypothetical protein